MAASARARFRWSRLLATATAALMLFLVVLVGLALLGVFDRSLFGLDVRFSPVRVWILGWVLASLLYGLLQGALAREIGRRSPGYPLSPSRAALLGGVPLINMATLPALFDEASRFFGERLQDPLLEQRMRYLARAPAAVALGGFPSLLLAAVTLPLLVPRGLAEGAHAGLALAWVFTPPLLRLWHMRILLRSLDDVVAHEEAAEIRASGTVPAAA